MFSLYRTLSLRHLRRRAGRAALVVVSIALGVATLVATRVLNRSMAAAARAATSPLAGAADLVAANAEAGVARELAADLRSVPGLRAVQPLLIERVHLPDLDRRALTLGVERPDSAAGPEALGVRVTITRPLALVAKYPVLVGEGLAAQVGSTVRARAAGHDVEFAVLGTLRLGGPAADLGDSLIVLDLDRATELFRTPGRVSRIDLYLQPDADPDAVRRAAQAAVGARAEVQAPAVHGQSVQDVISGVQAGFTLCGAGALAVGVFLVANA